MDVAGQDATQSVVAEGVRDFIQYLQASEGKVPYYTTTFTLSFRDL